MRLPAVTTLPGGYVVQAMKTPFRLQVSEYDCVPTTFLNGLSYLFERDQIPPIVVQRVFLYCLDSISPRREHGHGTTGYACALLANWLSEFRHPKFSLEAQYLEGGAVNLSGGNKIAQCLNAGGAALVSVTHYGGCRHYVMAIRSENRWLYFFDPYPKTAKASKADRYEFLPGPVGREANLRVHYDWADANSNKSPFRFGLRAERECVLLRPR